MSTGNDVDVPIMLTFDLSPHEKVVAEASIKSWQPLHLHIRGWNARLDSYENLLENNLQNGELHSFIANADGYMALVDTMTYTAVSELISQRQFVQKILTDSIALIFMISILLYFWLPYVGVAVDALSIAFAFAWCYLLEFQKRKLILFLESQKKSADERYRRFRENYLAGFRPHGENDGR